uniref:Uncharacterized protein n=1 Tax=Oryza nivara TaxID=4536 RepID=A0A0E0HEX6_ORYNI
MPARRLSLQPLRHLSQKRIAALRVDFTGDHRATASPSSRTHSRRRQGRDEGGNGDHGEPAPLTTEDLRRRHAAGGD